MSVEDKYLFTTAEDSVISRDWAAGSAKQLDVKEFIIKRDSGRYIGEYTQAHYAPAWWKIIDEPIVNALDHLIRCLGSTTPVTCIKIGFDKTGRVRIYNNGPGIEVAIHKTATEKLGREMWVPTFIFGTLFQGSNRKRADDSIIGGTNGLGAKLSNCFSSEFIVETVDTTRNLYFVQRWRNHKEIEEAPTIIDLNSAHDLPAERTVSHTTLSFLPDYTGLFGYEKFDETVYNKLVDVVRTRAIFAAAYAHYTVSSSKASQSVEVYFNDERLNIKSIGDIADILFAGRPQVRTTIVPAINTKAKSRVAYRYPWEVCAVVMNTSTLETSQLSNVNGVVVRDGKHTKHVLNLLTEGVKEKITKLFHDKNMKFSPTYVSGNIFVMVNSKIPNPSWTGQRKDVLDMDIRRLANYRLDPKFVAAITAKLHDQIVESIFNDTPAAPSGTKVKKIQCEKYVPARKAGTKKSLDCILIPVEGDSSMTQVCTGIAHNLGFELFGAISLGGVIMNARKECVVIETAHGKLVKNSSKSINNVFMNTLMKVTGLNSLYKYDQSSPTYREEMNELRYGGIAACVDQDLDGKGNILGLLLNTFELFWPNLLRAGYIKWFCTPIIRAYPKRGGKIISFYSTHEYDTWIKTVDSANFNIKYYKGIGTHSRDETIHMFKTFHEHLYTYYVDERSHELFEIYFGKDADLRKKQLALPNRLPPPDKVALQEATKTISCSDHLEYETDMFQKDNLERKLDHVIDGQNQAGRKILDGILKAFKGTNKPMKVAPLAGEISRVENYHHGEASLCDSVTGKGFVTTGGKQLPIIVPLSNFGSRKGGGNDAAQPRYIWCKLNKHITNLIFPECDYWMLPFNFDEGERSEPKYFVPIIPMAVTESTELPAHGWKLKIWGRDVFKVIENVRRLIRLGDDVQLLKMPPATYKGAPYEWTGDIKTIRGDPFSFGKYSLNESKNILRITELPLRVWTTPYVNMLKEKITAEDNKIIAAINDESDDIKVNIEVKLKPGAIALLNSFGDSYFTDGIEEYFQLRNHMDSHINLMGKDGEVIMFESYEAVVHKWFPVRKEFYSMRIDRERTLLQLRIKYLENIIKYIEICNRMNLSKRKIAEMIALLDAEKFDKIHLGKLNRPRFIPTSKLEDIILRGPKSNYDYLLNLSAKRTSEESLENFIKELAEVKNQLDNLNEISSRGRFPGAAIWETELEQLETMIREGQKTFWQFEDAGKFKFD